MFGAEYFQLSWLFGAALVGALLGILFAGRSGLRRGHDRRESEQRIRALEADVRVSQRNTEELRSARDALIESNRLLSTEAAALREAADAQEARARQLKAELQHECGKTARLRQELADRAEEMVRTSVHLRDAQTELGVARVGSDVILEQIARLEQERGDLSALVDGLRRELTTREDTGNQSGVSSIAPGQKPGRDQVTDC